MFLPWETSSAAVQKRDYCPYGQTAYNGRCEYSSWYFWGRWVVAAVAVIFVITVLVLLGCISSRRRRRRGLQPMYGTGWMANGKYGQPGPGYNNEMYPPPGGYQQPPPTYTPQPQYAGANDGFYGNHQNGVQYPQNSHQRDRDQAFSPPPGPPPGK